ncbi:MAG: M50 family metallopeptidase, partial [Nanoarchaeota archaeon]|nr:M50 family metallopeptidase [Nanoarchaeota archaeon]
MYKTKLGLKSMDRMAKKHPKFLKYLAYAGIVIGFLGMVAMCVILIQNFYSLVTKPAAVSGLMMVLPFEAEGIFYVPFFYWIISIFLLILVHEFSHGVIASLYKIKVKSSGLGFLNIFIPVIPLAFVELDEKELRKRPKIQQLSVFAAGSFSNIIFAFVVLAIMVLVMVPISNAVFNNNGVLVTGFTPGNETFPAENAGITENELIIGIDNVPIRTVENFTEIMQNKTPGESVVITTNVTNYNITLAGSPDNESRGYLGIYLTQNQEIKENILQKYGKILPDILLWISGLFYCLLILNLGIGLFNLVPLGPILDGGRMLQLLMHKLFKKKIGDRIWKA